MRPGALVRLRSGEVIAGAAADRGSFLEVVGQVVRGGTLGPEHRWLFAPGEVARVRWPDPYAEPEEEGR